MEKKKLKSYATTSSCNETCVFRKDYSYYTNGKCLECKFCYKVLSPTPRLKQRSSILLNIELDHNDSAIKVPVTVSRYCEPFFNETSIRNSIAVMLNILSKGGQIVIRSSKHIPDEVWPILEKFSSNIMYQCRVFASDTKTGNIIRSEIAPNLIGIKELMSDIKRAKKLGVETALLFDPFILCVNNSDLINIIKTLDTSIVDKIIVKQLYSTGYFKKFLSGYVANAAELLSEKTGDYWTYNSTRLAMSMMPIIELAYEKGISLSFCSNHDLAMMVGTDKNCCLFDNANAIYDASHDRKRPRVVKLKE